MAIITGSFLAQSIFRVTQYGFVTPNDVPEEVLKSSPAYQRDPIVIFLLHGLTANYSDWLINGQLQELSWMYNIIFVTPSGDNSFYLDGKDNCSSYGTFVGDELVDYIRKTYKISLSRENTVIAGLSMGGFGAIHVGLSHPAVFSAIIGLSSALIIDTLSDMKPDDTFLQCDYHYFTRVFGSLSELRESRNNPAVLAEELKRKGTEVPRIYLTCGTEDPLIEGNRCFSGKLNELSIPHTYVESTGMHNWGFWNPAMKAAVEWLLKGWQDGGSNGLS